MTYSYSQRAQRQAERLSYSSFTQTLKEEAAYFIGVDLGQSLDHTAIAIIELRRFLRSEAIVKGKPNWFEERPSILRCGHIERLPLHLTYPAIVEYVARLMRNPRWDGNVSLTIDESGVGRPVGDLYRSAGVPFIGLTITSGDTETSDGNRWRVPKITLVSRLQALLHEGRLHLHKDLPEAAELTKEMENFRVGFTDSGRMTFNAKSGQHDDMVLALAIAAWRAARPRLPKHVPFSIAR